MGSRVTIEITKTTPELEGVLAKTSDNKNYWGYKIQISKKNIKEILLNKYYDLTIGTSRLGDSLKENKEELQKRWLKSKNILIIFGSPRQGLDEIIKVPDFKHLFDFYLNTIPEQGCATVRTEEAIIATLAIFNIL